MSLTEAEMAAFYADQLARARELVRRECPDLPPKEAEEKALALVRLWLEP